MASLLQHSITEDVPLSPRRSAAVRRRELASFLRSRRERITPEQVGLAAGGRRRTPGLRREEVAQLAGVGVTWYTWIEQGRDVHASEQVLDSIARTLRLDIHERSHLFTLAGAAEPTVKKECNAVPATVHAMLGQLEPYPAVVSNARTDILAFNDAYDRLLRGLSSLPFEERNMMLLSFTQQPRPWWLPDQASWEDAAARMVANFRAAMAHHVAEPAWKALVKRLRTESPYFDELWDRHDVMCPENRTKRVWHPELGVLHLDFVHLWTGRNSEVRLTCYTPADPETELKLPKLMCS